MDVLSPGFASQNATNQFNAAAQFGVVGQQMKGTAVDGVNASIEALTSRVTSLTNLARRISDGILGVEPSGITGVIAAGPHPVVQSTQEHIKGLEAAFERLSTQVNRLG